MFFEYYLYYLYYYFLGYPFVIRFAIVCIIIFSLILITSLIKMIRRQLHLNKKKKLKLLLNGKYYNSIKDIITSNNNYSSEDVHTALALKKRDLTHKKKSYFTNIILQITNSEVYVNRHNYQKLIEYLNLRKFWARKLHYGNAATKQRALRKLDDLEINLSGSEVTSLVYNRNRYLRKKARASYIFFNQTHPFKFFNEGFDKTFNKWDKIEIHRQLCRALHEQLPNLSQWIKNSENTEFRCFIVDEISFFDQAECAPFILELINNTNNTELCKHCVDTLGNLRYSKAEEQLIDMYPIQPPAIQQSIIKAICKINSGKALAFLQDAFNTSHDDETRIIIAHAIFNYGTLGKQLFYSMKEITRGFTNLILQHVSNPLIKTY